MNSWQTLLKSLDQLVWWEIRFFRPTSNGVADAALSGLSSLAPPTLTIFNLQSSQMLCPQLVHEVYRTFRSFATYKFANDFFFRIPSTSLPPSVYNVFPELSMSQQARRRRPTHAPSLQAAALVCIGPSPFTSEGGLNGCAVWVGALSPLSSFQMVFRGLRLWFSLHLSPFSLGPPLVSRKSPHKTLHLRYFVITCAC